MVLGPAQGRRSLAFCLFARSSGAGRLPKAEHHPGLRLSRHDPRAQALHVCEPPLGAGYGGRRVGGAAVLGFKPGSIYIYIYIDISECGSKLTRRGKPQVLVNVSTYKGSIWVPIFDLQQYRVGSKVYSVEAYHQTLSLTVEEILGMKHPQYLFWKPGGGGGWRGALMWCAHLFFASEPTRILQSFHSGGKPKVRTSRMEVSAISRPAWQQSGGCGSKPMLSFWGRCTTQFSLF